MSRLFLITLSTLSFLIYAIGLTGCKQNPVDTKTEMILLK